MGKESKVQFEGYELGEPTTRGNLIVLLGEPDDVEQPLGLHGFCNGRPVRNIPTEFTRPATLELESLAEHIDLVCRLADTNPELVQKLVVG